MSITKHQRAAGVEKHRSEIKLADYNPRIITPAAFKKLKESIKTFGLLEPFIWNETTGNLVGGHQRLKALDDIEKTEDYHVNVTVVKLPIEKEKALNLALNNPSVQGEYDVAMIDDMLRNNEFDITLAGFTQVDLEMMYLNAGLETSVLDQMFNDAGAKVINDVSNVVDKLQDGIDGRSSPSNDGEDEGNGRDDPQPPAVDDKALIKERRKAFSEKAARENENDFYVTVCFSSNDEKQTFMERSGFGKFEPYIDGLRLAELCGVDLDVKQESDA